MEKGLFEGVTDGLIYFQFHIEGEGGHFLQWMDLNSSKLSYMAQLLVVKTHGNDVALSPFLDSSSSLYE